MALFYWIAHFVYAPFDEFGFQTLIVVNDVDLIIYVINVCRYLMCYTFLHVTYGLSLSCLSCFKVMLFVRGKF